MQSHKTVGDPALRALELQMSRRRGQSQFMPVVTVIGVTTLPSPEELTLTAGVT